MVELYTPMAVLTLYDHDRLGVWMTIAEDNEQYLYSWMSKATQDKHECRDAEEQQNRLKSAHRQQDQRFGKPYLPET